MAALAALLPCAVLAAPAMETNQLVDSTGTPIGTPANPLYVSGGGGGGGGGGSVTPAGTNGSLAGAVQGINGGVPVPVTQSAAVGAQEQDLRSTQTLNAATLNSAITVPVNGQGTLGFTITGLAASGATLTFEQSEDGGNTWTIVNEVNAGTGVATSTRTTDGQTRIAASGRTNIRFRVSTVGTGTITIAYSLSVREGMVTIASPVLTGQYNSVLPTLASGGYAVVALDANARQILSPSTSITVAQTATSSFSVAKTTGIGTTATQVSAIDANNRRTIRNTGSIACELMPAATAYGTGHPLPSGESFTFDASGRTTSAIFVACSSAGGAVSVVSY